MNEDAEMPGMWIEDDGTMETVVYCRNPKLTGTGEVEKGVLERVGNHDMPNEALGADCPEHETSAKKRELPAHLLARMKALDEAAEKE